MIAPGAGKIGSKIGDQIVEVDDIKDDEEEVDETDLEEIE